jgi:hypothetical protein
VATQPNKGIHRTAKAAGDARRYTHTGDKMKITSCLAVSFLVLIFVPQVGLSDNEITLTPNDNTKLWKFPYEVESRRANELHEGIMKLADLNKKTGVINVSDALNLLGTPDVVTDLEGAFAGLSPKEDGYLVVHRQELKWRLVWYLRKKSELPNLNDTWIGIYIKKNSSEIMTVILN